MSEAHTQLVSNHDLIDKCQRNWRTQVVCREVVSPGTATNEAKAEPRFRFFPHGLTPAAELLPLAQFSSTHEFLHQAQRRYTSGVHHSNWLALAEELTEEALRRGGRKAPSKRKKVGGRVNHKCWREAIRFVAVSQPGAGAFLNAVPMRDDMKMESWAMRVTVQRRLGLPLDVACQAVEAGKRAPSGRLHDVLGDAAMVESKWPALAKMVKQYFAPPASSAGVERVFSAAGKMHGELQKSAKDTTLEHSLFAAFNTD